MRAVIEYTGLVLFRFRRNTTGSFALCEDNKSPSWRQRIIERIRTDHFEAGLWAKFSECWKVGWPIRRYLFLAHLL